jgi:hypothetical protein
LTDQERYLFDLQGFLVIPGALTGEEVSELNAIMDRRLAVECPPDVRTHRFGSLLSWGPAYRRLIDHPRIVPYLEELVDLKFRLDHDYGDVICQGKGPIGTTLHGGASPFSAPFYYRCENGRMHNGLTVVAYNLKDVNPGDGGFGCVPGSHKSNFAFPAEWKELETLHPCVTCVTGPAGTAIIFTEALTHGTLPWRGSDQRRTLFYKYSPHALSWSAVYYDACAYDDLTADQRLILEPPNARYPGRLESSKGEQTY